MPWMNSPLCFQDLRQAKFKFLRNVETAECYICEQGTVHLKWLM